jgi:catechol 2,3-dioxygenase-like lactoylglutathione lyase family enzyme
MTNSRILRLGGVASVALLIAMGIARADGIPTIVGVDHIGMTVPKLQDGIDFFTKVLGCQYVYTAGPFADPKGKWMETNLAVDAGASTTLAMVRCGPTQNIELFEYDARDQVKAPMKNSDGDPTPVSGQPNGGETFVYFRTPWGANMELLTYPKGLDYEKTTDKRLYGVMKQ